MSDNNIQQCVLKAHNGEIEQLKNIFARQKSASRLENPLDYQQRIAALTALLEGILSYESKLIHSMNEDFGQRVSEETRLLEILPLVEEIRYIKRQLRAWMRTRSMPVNWQFFPSRAKLIYQPLGVVGIMGAWNYQILLSLSPLINALAAGNRIMLKPSEKAPATAQILSQMIKTLFAEEHVAVITGEQEVASAFASLAFDHLIFTGSRQVGQLVMKAAAENLTPVTLELGGKSPALVHDSYPSHTAAASISNAKFLNCGQTCIAPDYVLLPATKVKSFAQELINCIKSNSIAADKNTTMINNAAWQRMHELVADAQEKGAEIWQLDTDNQSQKNDQRYFKPTLVIGANDTMRVMQEEIFGPILPIISYQVLEDAINYINAHPRPLALYYFDKNRQRISHILHDTVSGGVTVNDCLFHFLQHALPFGGVGASGIGAYHGFDGFTTFSKKKGILIQHPLTRALLKLMVLPPFTRFKKFMLKILIHHKI